MAENYKHLYEQTKKMLVMYQDELIPGFRKQIEELEKNQVKVRCKDCRYYTERTKRCDHPCLDYDVECYDHWLEMEPHDFCSYGERKDNG